MQTPTAVTQVSNAIRALAYQDELRPIIPILLDLLARLEQLENERIGR